MTDNQTRKRLLAGFAAAASLMLTTPAVSAFPQNGGSGKTVQNSAQYSAVSGTVAETMNSGGYTYVQVLKDGERIWVAAPMMKVQVGDPIAFRPGMAMSNFTSKTLNRTFETIIFSPGLAGGAQASPAMAGGATSSATGAAAVKVDKAEGPNAYTIGEIYAKKKDLGNSPVMIQAQVVKVTTGILGKNWLHLQDGSGDQAAGTHDLVVTTDALPKTGDVVTISGTLGVDRDFGAGYRYDVIVEEATVQAKN